MQSLIVVLIVLFITYLFFVNLNTKQPVKQHVSRKFNKGVNISYSDGNPFETYCPYRALLGTWTNDDEVIKISLLSPKVLKFGDMGVIENPSCKISGRTLEIFGSGKKYILRDNKCLMTGKSGKPKMFSLV